MKELRELGLITSERRGNRPNLYEIVWPVAEKKGKQGGGAPAKETPARPDIAPSSEPVTPPHRDVTRSSKAAAPPPSPVLSKTAKGPTGARVVATDPKVAAAKANIPELITRLYRPLKEQELAKVKEYFRIEAELLRKLERMRNDIGAGVEATMPLDFFIVALTSYA